MAWRKWIVIGVSAGGTIVVLVTGLVAGLMWYEARPKPWKTDALTAAGGDVGIVMSAAPQTGQVQSFNGFRVSYTITNNTDADITISGSSVVKVRRAIDGALDDPPVPVTLLTTLIPAHRPVRVHLEIQYPFRFKEKQDIANALGRAGLVRDAAGGLVILDAVQRLEVRIPKPVQPGDSWEKWETFVDWDPH
jgi:hypothetical protein